MTLTIEKIEHGLILVTSLEHPALFAVGRDLSEVIDCVGHVLGRPEWLGDAPDGCARDFGVEHVSMTVCRVSAPDFPHLFIALGEITMPEVPLTAERAFGEMFLRAEESIAQEAQRLQRISERIRADYQHVRRHEKN